LEKLADVFLERPGILANAEGSASVAFSAAGLEVELLEKLADVFLERTETLSNAEGSPSVGFSAAGLEVCFSS